MPAKKTDKVALKTLTGDRVLLRPFRKGDLIHVQRWSEDPEMRRLTGEAEPMTREDAEKWYSRARADKDRAWYAIVLKDDGRVVGEAGLLRMFRAWRCTDMTVMIGEKDVWGRGYGTEAGDLLLDLAFNEHRMHRVSVGVVSFNERALRFWEGLGFTREGAQRDGYLCDGEFSDFVMMSILEDEYRRLVAEDASRQG